jgi:hypothetical protein
MVDDGDFRWGAFGNGSHSHTISTNASTTDAAGKETPDAVSTMPPYIAVYVWKRTA